MKTTDITKKELEQIKSNSLAAISNMRKSLSLLKFTVEKGTTTAGMVDDILTMVDTSKKINSHVSNSIRIYGKRKRA